MGFDFVVLPLGQFLELPLHVLERIVDDLRQRLVHVMFSRLLVHDEFMTWRNRHIGSHVEGTARMLRFVRMLDDHVTTHDVVAKSFQVSCLVADESFNLVTLDDTAVGDFNG